jgi:nitroimidazol reductase NimA-like FMN-containing flavoprotein (pyridoxamine 5'-phosphate oxidase superfamily)
LAEWRQKRSRAIAMTDEEVDSFLATEWVCRLASLKSDGRPHVAPLWFVWDGSAIWVYSIVRSQRWKNIVGDGRVSVVIDAGRDPSELRGVEVDGRAEPVGEMPRIEGRDESVAAVEDLFAAKYGRFELDGKHAWLRIAPENLVSWDFRKIGTTSEAGAAS